VPEKPKPADLAKRGGCWFETAQVKIHLGIDKDFHPATKAHPGLLVSDLQAIIERCMQKGFLIVHDAPLEGYQRVYVTAPRGNTHILEASTTSFPYLAANEFICLEVFESAGLAVPSVTLSADGELCWWNGLTP